MALYDSFGPRALILLAIGIAVFVAVIPTALNNLFDVNTTTWDAGTKSLFVLIPLVIVAVVLLSLLSDFGSGE
jgi:hypothetical protein